MALRRAELVRGAYFPCRERRPALPEKADLPPVADLRSLGFIGLGVMGKPMAKNLLAAGFEVTVHSRSPGPVDELVAAGAKRAGSAAECAEGRDAALLMLPDSPDSEAVVLGPGGVLEASRPAPLLCDMSSIEPGVSQRLAAAGEKRGVAFVDAPVSGGEPGAVAGELAIMAGGSKAAFERLEPVFSVLGRSAVLCGGPGAGGAVKLANQMIVAANIGAVAEALLFAVRSGLDPEVVVAAIRGGLAGSAVLDAKAPKMIAGDWQPGFRLELHLKDLDNALSAAQAAGTPVPLATVLRQFVKTLVEGGRGGEDHAAIARYGEDLVGTTIASGRR